MNELLGLGYSEREISEGLFMVAPPANCIAAAEVRNRYVMLNRTFMYLTNSIKCLMEGNILPHVEVNGMMYIIDPTRPTHHVPMLYREVLKIEEQLDSLVKKKVVKDMAELLARARAIGLSRLDQVGHSIEQRLQ